MAELTDKQTLKASHEVASKIEVRMGRSFFLAQKRLQRTVSIDQLALAIASGSKRKAQSLYPASAVKESLEPTRKIISDTYLRGGRIGLQQATEVMND